MTIAERITRLREEAGLTQSDLARRCDVDRRLVHAWERGYSRPGLDTLVRLAEALGVSVDSILRPEPAQSEEDWTPSQHPTLDGIAFAVLLFGWLAGIYAIGGMLQ